MVPSAPGPDQGQAGQGQGREAPRPKIKDPLGLLAKWLYLGQIIKAAHHGGELAAAYVIADYADEHGVAWPSQGRIAKLSGLSVRSTRDAVHRLVAAGFVEVIVPGGPGRSTRYRPRLELALEEGSLLKNNTDEEGSLLKRPASPDAEADFSNMRKVASSDPALPRLQGAGERRDDPCGPGGGPAAAPGLVVEEEEAAAQVPDLEIVLRRMLTRHLAVVPHKKDPGGPVVLQVVADALRDGVSLEAIEQAHSDWCASYKRRPNPQHDPSLGTWIAKRTWEKAPDKAETKLTTMESEEVARPVLKLVTYSWAEHCLSCDAVECPVRACPTSALHLESGSLHFDSAACDCCGVCLNVECPAGQDAHHFIVEPNPDFTPATTGEEYAEQIHWLMDGLGLDPDSLVEFFGLGANEGHIRLLADGYGRGLMRGMDDLVESCGLPLPEIEARQ